MFFIMYEHPILIISTIILSFGYLRESNMQNLSLKRKLKLHQNKKVRMKTTFYLFKFKRQQIKIKHIIKMFKVIILSYLITGCFSILFYFASIQNIVLKTQQNSNGHENNLLYSSHSILINL